MAEVQSQLDDARVANKFFANGSDRVGICQDVTGCVVSMGSQLLARVTRLICRLKQIEIGDLFT